MKNFRGFAVVSIILSCFLFGCAINVTHRVRDKLDLKNLNSKLETQTIDLSADGKCSGTRPLKVVNAETRTDKLRVNDAMNCKWYVIPKDMTDAVVKHLEKRLIESNLKVGEDYDNKILVSLEEIKAIEGVWSFGSSAKLKIQIPDIPYTQTYAGESGSGLGFHAVAYAIHLSIDNFLKDPVFQDYVKCR